MVARAQTRTPQRLFLLAVVVLVAIVGNVSAAKISPDLENAKVLREVDISSHKEGVLYTVTVRNTGTKEASLYIMPLTPKQEAHLSYLLVKDEQGAKLKTKKVSVSNLPAGVSLEDGTVFYRIRFANLLKGGDSVTLKIKAIFTHTLSPLPAAIPQDDPQLVVYQDSHYFLSLYPTVEQTMIVKLATSNIISRSTEIGTSRVSGNKITYGPSKDIPAFSWAPLSVHYENNHPFITMKTMRKDIEVSQWGNVAIEEHYNIVHTGAKLKGSFSRYDYQRGQGRSGAASFRTVEARLPRGTRDVYYRDEIGNISTSHVRDEGRRGVLAQLDPRFPMFGGWQTEFYIGYNIPSQHALAVDTTNPSRFVLTLKLGSPFEQAVIDKSEVRVVLPEGASDIEFVTPFPVDSNEMDTHFTYLDTVGRPVLVLHLSNLVKEHNRNFKVAYTFTPTQRYREAFLLISGFLAFFLASIVVMRIDLKLSDNASSTRAGDLGVFCDKLINSSQSLFELVRTQRMDEIGREIDVFNRAVDEVTELQATLGPQCARVAEAFNQLRKPLSDAKLEKRIQRAANALAVLTQIDL